MSKKATKKENLKVIKARLQVQNLPSKFEGLSANAIAVFVEHPELDAAIQIIIEQNNTIKSANGRRLVAENKAESLQEQLKKFLVTSKNEIIQLWQNLFGKATKADDDLLNQIGVVSNETYNQTILETKDELDDFLNDTQHLHVQLSIAKKILSPQQKKQLGIEYKKWQNSQATTSRKNIA